MMQVKPTAHLTLCVIALLSVAGCGKKSDDASASQNEEDRKRLAMPVAKQAPLEKFAQIASQPAQLRGEALLAFYAKWGREDGKTAVLHAESEGRKVAAASLREALRGWRDSDAEAADSWVRSIDSKRRMTWLATAFGDSLESTQARAEWVKDFPDPSVRRKLSSRLIVEFGRSGDLAGGLDWLEQNGESESRQTDIDQLVSAWIETDSWSASEALLTMREGKLRDSATVALVNLISPEDPDAGKRWAETIADENTRIRTLALVENFPSTHQEILPK